MVPNQTSPFQEKLGCLLKHYLDCLEEEDRKNLQVKLPLRDKAYLSPWPEASPEKFLRSELEKEEFVAADSETRFLNELARTAGNPERLVYGYPTFLSNKDYLAPLFFVEIDVVRLDSGAWEMRRTDPSTIYVNHHLFSGYDVEERRELLDELEGESGSFEARLEHAIALLDEEAARLRSSTSNEPLPEQGGGVDRWLRTPLLIRLEGGIYTRALRRELATMLKYPSVLARAQNSALMPLLEGGSHVERSASKIEVAEIFPLNDAQRASIQSAFSRRLTVITGPPGTGKSQVVSALLATASREGRSVLFASRNNQAVDVVRERQRDALGDDDWAMRLGRADVVRETRSVVKGRLEALAGSTFTDSPSADEDLRSCNLTVEDSERLIAQLVTIQAQLDDRLEQAELAEEALPASWRELELDLPVEYGEEFSKTADEVAAFAGGEWPGLLPWVKRFVLGHRLWRRHHLVLVSAVSSLPDTVQLRVREVEERRGDYSSLYRVVVDLQNLRSWIALGRSVREAMQSLRACDESRRLQSRHFEARQELAKAHRALVGRATKERLVRGRKDALDAFTRWEALSEQVITSSLRGAEYYQLLKNYASATTDLLSHLPVWIVTNLAARRSLPLFERVFDLVVLDEASQCDIASALPLLYRAKSAVIIGDPNQLQHISELGIDEEEKIARRTGATLLLDGWSYVQQSLYQRGELSIGIEGERPIVLKEHFRSHPEIIEFSNRQFYDGNLVIRTAIDKLVAPKDEPLGVHWHDVDGRVPEGIRSALNHAEATAVVELCEKFFASAGQHVVGIVTPFRKQKELLGRLIGKSATLRSLGKRLKVGTAHAFQGDEADLIVFSPVVSPGMRPGTVRWVTGTNHLLNVSVTRARARLHVVGNMKACLSAGGSLQALASYISNARTGAPTGSSSAGQERIEQTLHELGYWYKRQHQIGSHVTDFFIVSPSGRRYALDVELHKLDAAERRRREEALAAKGIGLVRLPRAASGGVDATWVRLSRLA